MTRAMPELLAPTRLETSHCAARPAWAAVGGAVFCGELQALGRGAATRPPEATGALPSKQPVRNGACSRPLSARRPSSPPFHALPGNGLLGSALVLVTALAWLCRLR